MSRKMYHKGDKIVMFWPNERCFFFFNKKLGEVRVQVLFYTDDHVQRKNALMVLKQFIDHHTPLNCPFNFFNNNILLLASPTA